jgi:hypothetical protein
VMAIDQGAIDTRAEGRSFNHDLEPPIAASAEPGVVTPS